MDHFLSECTKDFRMENGPIAFKKGTFYEWRFATDAEEEDTHCGFVFKSELGPGHFMSSGDVEYFFA